MKKVKVPASPRPLVDRGRLEAAQTLRRVTAVVSFLSLASISLPSLAAAPSCTFSTAGSVGFGTYDVFTTTANTSGVGSLKIKCTGGTGSSYVVSLSTGQSNSFTTRYMKNGTSELDYGLYIDSARTTIWGDGITSGTETMSVTGNGTTSLSVYGEIPAAQDVPIGPYSDSITATVTF